MSKIGKQGKAVVSFIRSCRVEFSKITWPSKKELIDSTWVVAGMLLLVSVFVLVCDQVLALGLRGLLALSKMVFG
ncbi:MAG: preprotein translocase subunit SecE [Lentisphaerae bacterium]|jgi:preprotein translocase subunit SecE|nr:preprotein translocase subunit SecE [Lentisphaerota bacterium]